MVDRANCALCKHPYREDVEDKIGEGILPKKKVAKELNMTVNEIIIHMEKHCSLPQIKSDDPNEQSKLEKASEGRLLKQITDKRATLINNIAALQERIDDYAMLETMGTKDAQAFVSLIKEVRQTIMNMAELDKQVQQEITITMQNFTELKALILSTVCDNCRQSIMAGLALAMSPKSTNE